MVMIKRDAQAISKFYTTRAAGRLKRTLNAKDVHQPLPRLMYDETYRAFQKDVPEALEPIAAFSDVSHDSSARFARLGSVGADLTSCLCVPGRPPMLRGVPPYNTDVMRRPLRLSTSWRSEAHLKWLQLVFDVFFEEHYLTGIAVRDGSSSGPPFMVSSKQDKIDLAHYYMQSDVQKAIFAACAADDFNRLVELRLPMVSHTGSRLQQEVFDKQRFILSDLDAAHDQPPSLTADRSTEYSGLKSMRARYVNGVPWGVNVLLATYLRPFAERFSDRFGSMFKLTTPGSTSRLLTDWYKSGLDDVATYDITQFEQTIPSFMFDAFADACSKHVDDDFGKFVRATFKMPFVVPPRRHPKEPLELIGDLSVRESGVDTLLSGVYYTSFLAKLLVATDVMIAYYGDARPTAEAVRAFFSNARDDIKMLCGGDDHCVLGTSTVAERVNKRRRSNGYFATDSEPTTLLLGSVYSLDNPGGTVYGLPVLSSLITKTFVPERDVTHPSRRNAGFGIRAKMGFYSAHPGYPEVLTAIDKLFRKRFGFSFSGYADTLPVSPLTDIDQMFVDDPDIIHFRVSAADVSPSLLKAYYGAIDQDQVVRIFPLPGLRILSTNLPSERNFYYE